MKRFWTAVIEPVIRSLAPKHIVEIGADTGVNTRNLLEYCLKNNCRLTSIDPKPSYDFKDFQNQYGANFEPLLKMSLDAIKSIDSCELMLIDGDHNWYTVYHELIEIEERMGSEFPLIMFHDTGWPYARRDMYYDPTNIPKEFIQQNRKAGLLFDEDHLSAKGGFNSHLHHAVRAGTERNGVLTGIEDFVEQSSIDLTLVTYQGMNGLSILYPSSRHDISSIIQDLNMPARIMKMLEVDRIKRSLTEQNLRNSIEHIQLNFKEKLRDADQQITQLNSDVQKKDLEIYRTNLSLQRKNRELKQLYQVAESMRIKNRLKRLIKPSFIKQGDIGLLIASMRKEGWSRTALKIRNRLQDRDVRVGLINKLKRKDRISGDADIKKPKTSNLCSDAIHIAFAVTDSGPNVAAGDYFTAMELANALEKLGYKISYVCRRSGDWYNLDPDVDVLVSMLDSYDLNRIKTASKKIISVAWIRNWPDRWCANVSLSKYDILLGSSSIICNMIQEEIGKPVYLFPIACNPDRFDRKENFNGNFISDYSFTGNFWGTKREIETALDPSALEYRFAVYGKDWDKVNKFRDYSRGFLNYSDIPKVYANCKIVIDDAAINTKSYGSVNSRVFDAAAAGALVLSNGSLGVKELFGRLIPVWNSQQDLHQHIKHYLSNDTERESLVAKIQSIVFAKHTYKARALVFNSQLNSHLGARRKIAIKLPVPSWSEAESWGDYHIGKGLKKYFERLGYSVLLQILPEWYSDDGNACDVVIVLRGLSAYEPKPHQINYMWNISHPDKVTYEEYNMYDKVFVASKIWADRLRNELNVPVETMYQCTDPEQFYPVDADKGEGLHHEILFVGNSRKIFRKALKDLIPCDYDLSVYGEMWEGLIDSKYIKGNHINNEILAKYYSSADIVLNDHWESMREYGFVSNRIFDVLASGGFVISDNVAGIDALFPESTVCTYDTKTEFHEKIKFYMSDAVNRENIASKGRELVVNLHSFENRVMKFAEVLEQDCRVLETRL